MPIIIEKIIHETLERVIKDNIAPVVSGQNPTYPCITYNRANYGQKTETTDFNPLKLRSNRGSKSEFQIVIEAKNYTQCCKLLRKVILEFKKENYFVLDTIKDGFEFDQLVFCIITQWSVWGELESDERQPINEKFPIIRQVTDNIINALKKRFTIETIEVYKPEQKAIISPALILDIEQLNIAQSLGDGRLPIEIDFNLHCLTPKAQPESEAQGLAVEAADVIYQNNFGIKTLSLPNNYSMKADTGHAGEYGFNHWSLKWQQTLYKGESVWDDLTPEQGAGITNKLLVSNEPKIGENFEDQYKEI